jgi:CRP-like cAMP-binding protein
MAAASPVEPEPSEVTHCCTREPTRDILIIRSLERDDSLDRAERKIRKLRDKAEKLRQAGNLKKALDIYHELEKREPLEPRWPHLAGEAHKRFGQINDSVEHFTKAAELYNQKGFDVKCVAMCKVLLAMDPLNETGNRLLEAVSGDSRPKFQLPQDPPPRSHSQAALAATGGMELQAPPTATQAAPAPPSRVPHAQGEPPLDIPSLAPPPSPKRTNAKETSPKELQALNLSDLEDLLDGDATPARPPPPPVATTPPRIPAPARPAPGGARSVPPRTPNPPLVSKPPRPDKPQGSTMGKFSESLDIAIEVEVEVEELDNAAAQQSSGADELVVTDNTFMESLATSQAEHTSAPRKHPTLEPDAPLASLELEDIMPGTRRKPSGPIGRKPTEELFEVDIADIEEIHDLENDSDPAGIDDEYHKAVTTKGNQPETTPPGLFKKLGIDAMKSLVAQMSYLEKQPGDVIVRQGEVGGSLYVIIRGEVSIIREIDGQRMHVATLGDGEFFGEMALLTDTPRVASVEAVTTVEMFEVSRDTLRRLIQEYPQVVPVLIGFLKDRLLEIFVMTSDLLRPVPEAKRWVLARKFKLYEIKEGKVILKEGKPSGGLMIFLAGTAKATRERKGSTVVLGELQPGSLVGEISLLTGGPAVATVTATSKAWLLAISQRQWKTLTNAFPQMRQYVERLAAKRRQQNAAVISGGATYTSQTLRLV